MAFDKQLSEEDLTYVKEKLKTLGAKEITWTYIDGASIEIFVPLFCERS